MLTLPASPMTVSNADADLARWRDGKLKPRTRELIEVVRREGVDGARDPRHRCRRWRRPPLASRGRSPSAIDVDASREYLAIARSEAERRGLQGRVEHRYGDVVELADDLQPAEIVTLDSVICCYPYLEPLLGQRRDPDHGSWELPIHVTSGGCEPSCGFTTSSKRFDAFLPATSSIGTSRSSGDGRRGYQNVHEGGIRVWRVVLYRRTAAGR